MGQYARLLQFIAFLLICQSIALISSRTAAAQDRIILGSKQCPAGEQVADSRAEAVKFLKDYHCDAKGNGTCKGKCVNGGSVLVGLGEKYRATRSCKCASLH
jgi:hypothetical protein